MIGEQAVTSYMTRRSAKTLGHEMQSHELRKDSMSLSKRILREVVRSHVFNLELLKLIK
jgi:hypothetical protein